VAYVDIGAGLPGPDPGRRAVRPAEQENAARMDTPPARRQGMLELFLRTQLRAGATMPLIAVLFALALSSHVDGPGLLLWLLAVIGISGLDVLLCRMLLEPRALPRFRIILPPRPERLLVFTEGVQALLWTVPLFHFWLPDAPLQHLFIISVLMVVSVVRILMAFSHMPVMLAGSTLITLAIVVRCLITGDIVYVFMAALAVVTHIFLLTLARRLHDSAADMLALRAQKEQLIRRLEEARDRAEKARKRAEAANRAKSRFLANMSHELRTPLNAIMGFSEIISREMFGPLQVRQYREYAADIHHSGQYLLSLINDILDLSKIEAGHYALREEPVDLAEQARKALKLMAIKAREKRIALVTDFPPVLPSVLADARAVRQIWLNLLSNAIKFTPADGRVEMRLRETADGGLEMEVADNGPGIPAEELAEITEAFTRGRQAQSQAVEGVGLGLSIVRGLARLHEATVHVDSVEGAGTRVRVIFPPHRVHAGETFMEDESAPGDYAHRRLMALMDR